MCKILQMVTGHNFLCSVCVVTRWLLTSLFTLFFCKTIADYVIDLCDVLNAQYKNKCIDHGVQFHAQVGLPILLLLIRAM